MNLRLVPGLTETSESPRPARQPPAADHHQDTSNPPTSSTHRLGKRRRPLPSIPNNARASTSATPRGGSTNKRPRSHDTADAYPGGQSPKYRVTFHPPFVHTNTVPTASDAAFRAAFKKVRRLDPEAGETSGLRETKASKVLREWQGLRKRLDSGRKVCFDGHIKSKAQYDDISTKLLRCLEDNCPSTRHFTRTAGLKKHMIGQHLKPNKGETAESFLARKAAAANRWVWEEKYASLIEDYRSLSGRRR